MKTVVFLTRRFYPDIGVVETHALRGSRGVVIRGDRVVIITKNLKYYMSDFVTFIDQISLPIFGASNIFLIVKKP